MSKPSRPAVDNDVTFPPPTQTLSVTKHTRREQIDNDVSIPHHPKQKCNKKKPVSLPVAWGRHWELT